MPQEEEAMDSLARMVGSTLHNEPCVREAGAFWDSNLVAGMCQIGIT